MSQRNYKQMNMEHKIEPYIITYKELREGSFDLPDDKYGIGAYVLTPSRVKSILECPFVKDDDTIVIYFVLVDGVIAGRETYFASRLKIDNEVVETEAASAFEVEKSFRNLAIGADIVMATFTRSKLFVGAGVSSMALPLDRKLKFHVLEFPRFVFFKNPGIVLKSMHLGFLSGIVDFPVRIFNRLIYKKAKRLAGKYVITKVDVIPEWVDDIILNDGHKYAEYHTHDWLQWNLDNKFMDLPKNNQSFYCVYSNEEPIGFYMIKERFRQKTGPLVNAVIGSLVEWGTKDEEKLNERDILLLSILSFSPDVDVVETATACSKTASVIRKIGFMPHGKSNIVFKDRTKKYKDASEIDLWRVRMGYGDVILSQ